MDARENAGFSEDSPLLRRNVESEVSTITTAKSSTYFGVEAKILVKTSVPVIFTYFLEYSFALANILFIGHLGPEYLSAASLGIMTLTVFAWSPVIGFTFALATILSTSFTGSTDKKLYGFHFNTGVLTVFIHYVIVSVMFWNAHPFLILLGQDPEISRLWTQFMRVMILGMLPWMLFECLKVYLQAQGHMKASTYVLMIVAPIHFLNNYLLIWSPSFGIGFLGAPLSASISYWLMFLLLLAYAKMGEQGTYFTRPTWNLFKALIEFNKLAIPSAFMICCEWWAFELLSLCVSYLGEISLSAHFIVMNTCYLTFQFANGFSVGLCNRVGNLLGSTDAVRAKASAYIGLIIGFLGGALNSVFLYLVCGWWGGIFTNDAEVIAVVAELLPVGALFQVGDAMIGINGGVIRALGRQKLGAALNIPGYYLISFPLGLYLTYGPPQMGVMGLWWGLFTGIFIVALSQLFYILAIVDWDEEVARCTKRISKAAERKRRRQMKSSHK